MKKIYWIISVISVSLIITVTLISSGLERNNADNTYNSQQPETIHPNINYEYSALESSIAGCLVDQGTGNTSPNEYLDHIESIYIQQRYRKLKLDPENVKRSIHNFVRIDRQYWRQDLPGGIGMIYVFGNDSNPHSKLKEFKTDNMLTVVKPDAGGGVIWLKYKIDKSSVDVAKLISVMEIKESYIGAGLSSIPIYKELEQVLSSINYERGE